MKVIKPSKSTSSKSIVFCVGRKMITQNSNFFDISVPATEHWLIDFTLGDVSDGGGWHQNVW